MERPQFDGIDSHRPNQSGAHNEDTRHEKYVTYEELQRKNREEYAIKHTVSY